MGAWGVGPFENDDEADWAYELEASTGDAALMDAFEAVLGHDAEVVDLTPAANAIGAAEVTATALGKPAAELTDGVAAWIAANREAVTAATAERALEAVIQVARHSELRVLWDEAPDAAAWRASIEALIRRLAAV